MSGWMTGRDDDAGRVLCSFGEERDIVGTCVVPGVDLCGGQEGRVAGKGHCWVSVIRVPPQMPWGLAFTVSPSLPHNVLFQFQSLPQHRGFVFHGRQNSDG